MKTFVRGRRRAGTSRCIPRSIGAHFVGRDQRIRVRQALKSPRLQTKLTVSAPNDVYEQEADRVANEVMRMTEPSLQRVCDECTEELSRQPIEEEEEELQLHRHALGEEQELSPTRQAEGFSAGESVEARVRALQGAGGQPLPESARSFFEPRFATGFNDVRVHASHDAAEVASDVRARAFTLGNHIVFGQNRYSPGTESGRRLLAHELTHVLQQRKPSGD